MKFGLNKIWSVFSLENVLSILPTITARNVDDKKSNKTIESINSDQFNKTKYGDFGIINIFIKNFDLISSVKAEENRAQVLNPWQDLMIKGPSSYSKMRKLFDDALITCKKESHKLTGKFNDDVWKLKLENTNNSNNLKLNVHRKMRTSGMFSPFFQIGNKNNIGVKIKAHDSVSISAGLSKKYKNNTLWSSVAFRHPAAAIDTKIKLVNHPAPMVVKMNVSGVLGHSFGKFGILAGSNLACDSFEYFNWKVMCQAISLSIVSSNVVEILTIQPKNKLFTIESCLKKDSFEFLGRSKANYMSPTWRNRDHEVGLKYKHSVNVTYCIKSDFAGNVTAGTWIKTPSFKVALLAKTSMVRNIGVIENYGISVEI